MVLSSSNSESSGRKCAPIIEAHTEECLEEMKNISSGTLADVIILIGRTGVGKSAFLEYLTNTQGHSKNSHYPATLEFHLEPLNLSGKRYYIMDTPGFDTDKEQAVFREIVRGIEAVRAHARIVGVMLVTRINDGRAEAIDDKLIAFVDKLCGIAYAAQVTAVTNFWNVSEPDEKQEFEARLEESLQRWRAILGQELKQYQHGRRYSSNGEDIGECLKWRGDSDEIKAYAKAMINRHYGVSDLKDPVIIQELSQNRPLGETAAGQFLEMVPSLLSNPPNSESSPRQEERANPPPTTSAPDAEDTPRPSTSSHRANRSQSQSRVHSELSGAELIRDGLIWVLKQVIVPVVQDALHDAKLGTGPGRASGRFPSHLDPLSSKDHFRARGLPDDLGFRTQWAQEHGITLEPGSEAFGDGLRNLINREMPL